MPIEKKIVEVDRRDAAVIKHALLFRLKEIRAELVLLESTREKDLTPLEREMLPANLQALSQEELKDQIGAWISLQMHYEDLIAEFTLD